MPDANLLSPDLGRTMADWRFQLFAIERVSCFMPKHDLQLAGFRNKNSPYFVKQSTNFPRFAENRERIYKMLLSRLSTPIAQYARGLPASKRATETYLIGLIGEGAT